MSKLHQIASNTATQMLGRFVGTVFGVLTIAVMTRALGAEGYGHFTLAFTFLAVAGAIVDFGFTLTTTQMISEEGADESRIVSSAMTVRIVSGIVLFGLAALVGAFMPYDPIVRATIAVGAFSFFFMTLSQMFIGVFQKHLSMWRPATSEAVSRGIILILIVVLATTQVSVPHMMGAFAVGNALMALINILFARSFTPIHFTWHHKTIVTFISRSWPIAATIFFNLLYLKGDIVFMSFYRSSEEIGLYGAAYKVLDVISVVPTMFMGLILPMLVLAWTTKRRQELHALLQQAFDLFAIISLPILGGTFIVAGPLMALAAGEEFRASGPYLMLLMLANTFVFFGILFSHAVVAINKQRAIIPAFVITAIVAVVLYLATIPSYGALGAAWTTIVSEAMIMCLTFWMVRRTAAFAPRFKSFGVGLLSACAMTALGFLYLQWVGNTNVWNLLVVVIGCAAFYGVSVVALGGVRLATLKSMLPRV